MNTLVVYDNAGWIFFQGSGSIREPQGIPFKWIDVPDGKIVVSMDVETDEPIYEDVPVDPMTQLRMTVNLMQEALDELILGGGT